MALVLAIIIIPSVVALSVQLACYARYREATERNARQPFVNAAIESI